MKQKKAVGMMSAMIIGFVSLALANDFLDVRIGTSRKGSRSHMAQRIYQLELAVNQLQDQVDFLQRHVVLPNQQLPDLHTCYIETTFDGTFQVSADTQTQARAQVLQQCSSATRGSLSCKSSKVVCGQ